jgi:hypothetical protein
MSGHFEPWGFFLVELVIVEIEMLHRGVPTMVGGGKLPLPPPPQKKAPKLYLFPALFHILPLT